MIIRRKAGLTEFIPSPREKREGLISDYILALVENLHRRIKCLEHETGLPPEDSEVFDFLFKHIQKDENRNLKLHTSLIAGTSSGR